MKNKLIAGIITLSVLGGMVTPTFAAVKNKNECTGTVTCSSSGCICSNNPNWHP